MLLGLGPFRFTVPTFSVESISLQTSARAVEQDIIGAPPSVHLLGPGGASLSMKTTFHPLHMNLGGQAMIAAIRAAQAAQTPLMFASIAGDVFGRWVVTGVDTDSSLFSPMGTAQNIEGSISLMKYPGLAQGGFLGLFQ